MFSGKRDEKICKLTLRIYTGITNSAMQVST